MPKASENCCQQLQMEVDVFDKRRNLHYSSTFFAPRLLVERGPYGNFQQALLATGPPRADGCGRGWPLLREP